MRIKKTILYIILVIFVNASFGQFKQEVFQKTIWCENDSFYVKFSGYSKKYLEIVSKDSIQDIGTDASLGLYVLIYYGKDSARFNYHNKLPYGHNYLITLKSPKGKAVFKLHFNKVGSHFSDEYIKKNNGNVQFEIPEVYELANIIWLLSPNGERAKDLNKKGDYYEKVITYFKPYLNHRIFKSLNFADSISSHKYYEFRENSFAFNFSKQDINNNKLFFSGPYYFIYGNRLADSSLFGKLKELVEDFSEKSAFRKFYKSNTPFYEIQKKRERELMPMKKMWGWLEREFPEIKYNSYKVVFSPIIDGSHSTQQFYTPMKYPEYFSETVMFVCGPDRDDAKKELTEQQKEGLLSGVVFTEIDHNYVNPTTYKYRNKIDSIFSNRKIWAKKGASSDFYGSNISVFNEYMTHAIFSLYIYDYYELKDAEFIINKREVMNADLRGFIKFREFNKELLRLRREKKELKVVDLYPKIIEWCGKQV